MISVRGETSKSSPANSSDSKMRTMMFCEVPAIEAKSGQQTLQSADLKHKLGKLRSRIMFQVPRLETKQRHPLLTLLEKNKTPTYR